MGYLSVVLLYNMIKIGVNNTLVLLPKSEGGDVIIDTGIDVVTKENLANYVELLDKWGVQHTFKP
jgi:ribose transport system substrate-binding protein